LAKLFRRCSLVLDCDDLEAANNRFQSRLQGQLVGLTERLAIAAADHITTHTSVIQNHLVAMHIPLHKITYLPHGIDLYRFSTVDSQKVMELRETLELRDKKVVVYVGSMSSVCHALDLLMHAFVDVQRQVPESVLLFVGGGEDYENLQGMATRLGLSGYVRFTGRVDPEDVPLFYALGDVSVAPVQNNAAGRASLSLKMFESWASGVPFVTVDVGDRRAVMGTPPAGVLVPPDDAPSMASAIVRLLSDPDERQILRDRQVQLAGEYGWDGLAERVERLYLSLGVSPG
jgi:glycosyltransferase involved in cell wall biosynthesis